MQYITGRTGSYTACAILPEGGGQAGEAVNQLQDESICRQVKYQSDFDRVDENMEYGDKVLELTIIS